MSPSVLLLLLVFVVFSVYALKCPECEKTGQKSTVTGGDYCTKTMLYCPSYYDEDGKYVANNCNTCTCGYECSNGHKWSDLHSCN